MAGTYSRIYLHFVFAVQGRQSLIPEHCREELHKYITGLVEARGAKMLAIYCMPDHMHLFAGVKPSLIIPNFIKEIKVHSNEFIRAKNWVKGVFHWQEGYGVFSYGHSQFERVCSNVLNQEGHHKKKTFKEEYHSFLEKFSVPFEEKYLFEWVE